MVLNFLPRKDLSAFSCASKHHRALVEPSLYREIRWGLDEAGPEERSPPVHLLLRTILDRPELASYINCLAFCLRQPRYQTSRSSILCMHWKEPDPTSTEMMRVRTLIRSFQFAAEDVWISQFEKGGVDLFIALVILQSINLRHLILDDDYKGRNAGFLGELFEKAVAMKLLCALEHVELGKNLGDPNDDL